MCTYLQRVTAIHAKRYIQLSKTAFLTISPAQVSVTSASVVKGTPRFGTRQTRYIFTSLLDPVQLFAKKKTKPTIQFYNAYNLFQIWTEILSFPDHYRYLRPLVYDWNRDRAKQLLQCATLHTKYHITESRESENIFYSDVQEQLSNIHQLNDWKSGGSFYILHLNARKNKSCACV